MAEWIDVISGVPQGSVLEPLLFLIFVQDLPDCIGLRTISKLFADDTKIWTKFCQSWRCKFPPAGSILQWSAKWPLEFNPLKCKVMKIGHKSYLPTRCTMLHTHITCVDTVWNCSCPGVRQLLFERRSSAQELSVTGTLCHNTWWKLHQWTASRIDWTSNGRIWASKAQATR